MSGEAEKKEDKPLTEAEVHANIDADLEKAQDDAFGSDEEISAQAAVEAGEKSQEEVDKELAEKKAADEEAAKKAEAEKEKTPEELEAEKKAEAEKTPEQIAAEKKAADEAAKKSEEKKVDEEEEDPYEVPEDMKGRTRERFEKLTGNLKSAHEKVAEQEKVLTGFREVIKNTGLSPDEVQRTLNIGSLIKSNPKQAREALLGIVSDLSKQLDIPEPGANVLEGFDDLKQQVADREITLEAAREIAEGRIEKKANEKQQALDTERRQQQDKEKQDADKNSEDFKVRVEGAQGHVGTYLKSLEADPDYEAAAPHLVTAAQFAAQNLAPEKWLEYIKGEYTKIKEIAGQSSSSSSSITPIIDGGAPPGGKQEPQDLDQLADQML